MVFGHNTNITIETITYHVQTEDRGETHALIDTTVYYQGRVLHRRTNNYIDLLPMNEDRRPALKLRVDEQHRKVLEEMQSGSLLLAIPRPAIPPSQSVVNAIDEPKETASARGETTKTPVLPRKLNIELINAKSWLAGKQATLQISVKEESGVPVAGAKIDVQIDGSAENHTYVAESGIDGQAQVDFAMPKIASAEAAMVIRAEENAGRGQLRFALRAKPKVPSL
jgi:hypothetical protein